MYAQPSDNDPQAGVNAANGILGQWNGLISQQQDILSQLLEENRKLKVKLEVTEVENRRMKKAIDGLIALKQGSLADLSDTEKEEELPKSEKEVPIIPQKSKQDKHRISEGIGSSTVNDDSDQSGFQLVKKKKRVLSSSSGLLTADASSAKSESSITSNEQAKVSTYKPPFKSNGLKKGWTSSQGENHPKESRRPCNIHYLVGQCQFTDCQYEHGVDLSEEDFRRLRVAAKQQPCKYVNENKKCWMEDCIYGHKCPHGIKCRYRASNKCKFIGKNMHGDDSDGSDDSDDSDDD